MDELRLQPLDLLICAPTQPVDEKPDQSLGQLRVRGSLEGDDTVAVLGCVDKDDRLAAGHTVLIDLQVRSHLRKLLCEEQVLLIPELLIGHHLEATHSLLEHVGTE